MLMLYGVKMYPLKGITKSMRSQQPQQGKIIWEGHVVQKVVVRNGTNVISTL